MVPLRELPDKKYGWILCYPSPTKRSLEGRIRELSRLSIVALDFTGPVELGSLHLLGKGTSSVVVIGITNSGKVALKIRRVDSRRKDTRNEVRTLKLVNGLNLGPRILGSTRNVISMELIGGEAIIEWVESVSGTGSIKRLKRMILELLRQCQTLDEAGIDHGELSNLRKHVIIDGDLVTLIDFESSSTSRRTSNVTSAVQYLFIGGPLAPRLRKVIRVRDVQELLSALRKYKRQRKGTFAEILIALNLTKK